MNKITLKIPSKAKDILNLMLEERDGLGYNYIAGVIDCICWQMKQLQNVPDLGFRNKLIGLLIESKKSNIDTDSVLPEDMKTHLQSFIDTIGKKHIRTNIPTYVVFDPKTLKIASDLVKRTENSADKLCKRLSKFDGKEYKYDTLNNYINRKYEQTI